jgi:predicted transcriptional regulator
MDARFVNRVQEKEKEMNSVTAEKHREGTDEYFRYQLNFEEWKSIVEIGANSRCGRDTIQRSLNRMMEAGEVERRWRGNERFGCYEYRRKAASR